MEKENIKWEYIPKAKVTDIKSSKPSKVYNSLYEELSDKCYPQNFMEPYDKEKVDKAILIYEELLKTDKENDSRIREIRDKAMRELGINISTNRLYNKLIDYCDPKNFLDKKLYKTDVLQLANHFYALVQENKNDIHELEKLSSQIFGNQTLQFYNKEKKEKREKEDMEKFYYEDKEMKRRKEEKRKREAEKKREILLFVVIVLGIPSIIIFWYIVFSVF